MSSRPTPTYHMPVRRAAALGAMVFALLGGGAAKSARAWINVPTGCESCPTASECVVEYRYTYFPGWLYNAAKGDLAFDDSEGALTPIMTAINQTHTHVGIMRTIGIVRHAFLNFDNIAAQNSTAPILQEALKNFLLGLPLVINPGGIVTSFWNSNLYGAVKLSAHELYHGAPGSHDAFITEEGYFVMGGTSILKARTGHRVKTMEYADLSVSNGDEYRLNAFVDLPTAQGSNGNMCSGVIQETTAASSTPPADQLQIIPYSQADLGYGIAALRPAVVAAVMDSEDAYYGCACSTWGSCGPNSSGTGCWFDCAPFGLSPGVCISYGDVIDAIGGDYSDIANTIRDQVHSCFVADQPGGCSSLWYGQNNIVPAGGAAISPDDIINQQNDPNYPNHDWDTTPVPAAVRYGYIQATPTGYGTCRIHLDEINGRFSNNQFPESLGEVL